MYETVTTNRKISIHALRVEGDRFLLCHAQRLYEISIHALRVEGDLRTVAVGICNRISIHALRVEGDICRIYDNGVTFWISIHALRVEGDQVNPPAWDTDSGISIHALRVEGDAIPYILRHCVAISIHALRVEGDQFVKVDCALMFDFYPRPPGGGRPITGLHFGQTAKFLSTPSGWRATNGGDAYFSEMTFLSTPSGWRATTRHL